MIRWNVRGYTRIGIFAKRDIEAGEPLSYDYQFDTQEENVFRCFCGKSNCRGTMAPKKKNGLINKDNLTRAEKSRLIAAGKLLEKRSQELKEVAEISRSLTSKFLPGDNKLEIRHGPVKHSFPYARFSKLFLPRTARKGNNFLNRASIVSKRKVNNSLSKTKSKS